MRRSSISRPARASALTTGLVLAVCAALLLPSQAVATQTGVGPAVAASETDPGGGDPTPDPGDGSGDGGTSPETKRPPFKAAPQSYNPPAGLKTNNPLARKSRRTEINRHLLRLINSVPGSYRIKIASWNLRSWAFVDALLRAHRRGVGVRVVVARGNANPDNPNRQVNRLEGQLEAPKLNKSRSAPYRSRLTRCRSACRGPRGISHSKFFLFERVGGGVEHVVVNGSANATDVAARAQWNDAYTVKGRARLYREFETVFNQMMRDKNVAQPFVSTQFGNTTTFFHPYRGAGATGDPVMRRLNQTKCRSAGGRTKLRIAMTSWHGQRGMRIAKRVKQMYNSGCNVRIIYAVAGNQILWVFRRYGGTRMPHRQIAQDPDGDGLYNRYLHMKVLTIAGSYRGNPNARVVFNGSENWSPAAIPSDEAGMQIYSGQLLGAYNRWIEYLYANPPYRQPRRSSSARTAARPLTLQRVLQVPPAQRTPAEVELVARSRGVDPYALIQVD